MLTRTRFRLRAAALALALGVPILGVPLPILGVFAPEFGCDPWGPSLEGPCVVGRVPTFSASSEARIAA